jgi:hypothetical protein
MPKEPPLATLVATLAAALVNPEAPVAKLKGELQQRLWHSPMTAGTLKFFSPGINRSGLKEARASGKWCAV